MNLPRLLFNAFIMLLVTGCATMDKSECEQADWRIIGLEDGAEGRPVSYIGRHRKACAEYGIKPNLALYGSLPIMVPDKRPDFVEERLVSYELGWKNSELRSMASRVGS